MEHHRAGQCHRHGLCAGESAESVTESGKPAAQAPGVQFVRMEQGRAVFRVGSGSYSFQSPE